MNNVIRLELKRNVVKGSILGFIAFVLVAILVLQIGVDTYKIRVGQQPQFVEIEQKTAGRLINYMQYATIGFRVILEPSPLVALFYNNTAFGDIVGIIDSGVRLRLNEPKIGPNTFKSPTGSSLDYSWYLLTLGSLFVMAWGFFSFRGKGYLKFLMNFATPKGVYLGIFMGRVLLITFMIAILGAVAYLQFLANSITLADAEISNLLLFLALVLLTMVFLLLIAASLGAAKSWMRGGMIAAFSWLMLVVLWPEALNVTFSSQAASAIKSTYTLEAEKMDILMDFEQESLKKTGRYITKEEKKESDKRMAENYWNNIYQNVEDLDIKMIEHTARIAKRFHLWSLFNPVTFFKSVNNEISSIGFTGFLELYKGNREKKRGFLRYYFNKRFKGNYSKVVPYLPHDKTIIAARSGLPSFFGVGLALTLVYIALALFIMYFRFRRFIFTPREKDTAFNYTLDLHYGKLAHIGFDSHYLKDQFLNPFLENSKDIPGKITINGQELTPGGLKQIDIFYIPTISKFPAMLKAKTLVSLLKGILPSDLPFDLSQPFGKFSSEEQMELFFTLARLKKSKIIIMDDISEGLRMSYDGFEVVNNAKKKTGALIFDLSISIDFTGRADQAYLAHFKQGTNIVDLSCTHLRE